ncbi:type II toxin-antitoxin system HicA family toxin [Psychrobacter immobilis]|uniref:type II toxin-antitoxin system HicA family toxin n=1 Tax=Psychrobacter immobilis TaxID=498 RepID=UPI00191A5200|nr:type II toxin-antitoxin system HicA family toxin [Psychrobacter immobilis]
MKARDVIKCIKRHGWSLKRVRGSHNHFMHSKMNGLVTVPFHGSKDLHPNIVNSISKMTGISF